MNAWDLYTKRITNSGATQRDRSLKRELYMLKDKLPNSLSYHNVVLNEEERRVAIINSDNLNEKMIYSVPGEDIDNGSMVSWMDNMWLVTERDANSEVYTRAKIVQCNYLLKWIEVDDENKPSVYKQWCVVDDGTKLECVA